MGKVFEKRPSIRKLPQLELVLLCDWDFCLLGFSRVHAKKSQPSENSTSMETPSVVTETQKRCS